jgi:anti-sigma B factor antagonist
MPLEIKILRAAGDQGSAAVTIQLSGSLDTSTTPELERQLTSVLAGPIQNVVFDLAQLKFLSSAGIRIFSMTRKTLQERGGQESFVNLQPQIAVVFEVIKTLPGIAVFKDAVELDRYLALLQRSHPGHR